MISSWHPINLTIFARQDFDPTLHHEGIIGYFRCLCRALQDIHPRERHNPPQR
ncbi:hypothetical protein B0H34DRAFT_690529 [Crassisporium funariophilum]|nr:hypothetical protein B0H34DRAFT_690529 [Crassisporium funariophilum]